MIERKIIKETGFNLEGSYLNLPDIFFTIQYPTSSTNPELIIFNNDLIEELGLNIKTLGSKDGLNIFAGNSSPEGAVNIAQAYAGHQYGHFTMLGDGRAVLIGEHITEKGERFDIQLKGSGRTPYSRGGDGRASIGPMLREYIISEGMKGLGIPTTRTLAVVKTGESVIRQKEEAGAVMTRVASSHIRVGTFQYAAKFGDFEDVKTLADYTIDRHFKEIAKKDNPYISLLEEVIKRQAYLIAKWQLVGFVHGVMNTDNMAISGETIDYGPCAFMDVYSPSTVFSSIDYNGRYSYGNQPEIAVWNLARFAESLLPFINSDIDKAVEIAQKELSNFEKLYNENWISGMRSKIGIFNEEKEDEELIQNLLNLMEKYKSDYTNTFRNLTLYKIDEISKDDEINNIHETEGNSEIELFRSDEFKEWSEAWKNRLTRQGESEEEVKSLMKNSNPSIIPRNHKVEEALKEAEKGNYKLVEKLVKVISNPYSYYKDQDEYIKLPKKETSNYRTYCGT